MSIGELLPAVSSLPAVDKIELMRLLAEDSADGPLLSGSSLPPAAPIWSPHGAFDAADTLLAALEAEKGDPAHA